MYHMRQYQQHSDLIAMQDLLRDGIRADSKSYLHPGDIEWWLYYNPTGEDLFDNLRLWHDDNGRLVGWMLCVAKYGEFDLFVHPTERDNQALIAEMLDWMEAHLRQRIPHTANPNEVLAIECGSGFANHTALNHAFTQRGYVAQPHLTMLVQSLERALPTPVLPAGYHFLEAMDGAWVAHRAEVHVEAFTNSRMTAEYYRWFMRLAPHYDRHHDIVAVAPDGQFVAFAMTWTDDATGRGEFEPVGTRASHQRMGLGKAVMLEGLRRLQARGMRSASVCCHTPHTGTVAFYRSAGFEIVNEIYLYSKPL